MRINLQATFVYWIITRSKPSINVCCYLYGWNVVCSMFLTLHIETENGSLHLHSLHKFTDINEIYQLCKPAVSTIWVVSKTYSIQTGGDDLGKLINSCYVHFWKRSTASVLSQQLGVRLPNSAGKFVSSKGAAYLGSILDFMLLNVFHQLLCFK